MVKIFIPRGENAPFPTYTQEGLIEVVHQEPEIYTTIERSPCACNTLNDIAVYNDSIFVRRRNQYIVGSSCYRIIWSAESEFITSVLWLVKSRFYTFSSKIVKFQEKGTGDIKNTFERRLTPFFFTFETLPCKCLKYSIKNSPVYCLKHIVLSGKKKGPTINSVI